MPVHLDWKHVALRLALTVVAGIIIGINRSERGRAAGMRTTLLVCLAASLAMIQANLLLDTVGKASDSFIVMDLMRFPLGILSGMGFIGAGTILRKDSLVLGVTTAATLWFSTVMGLCFGGGQVGLGVAALILGFGTLWGLRYVEGLMRENITATLVVSVSKDGPSDDEIRTSIARSGWEILSWGISYIDHAQTRETRGQLRRRAQPKETQTPAFVAQMAQDASVSSVVWQPQGVPTHT